MASDTRDIILQVARRLFIQQGYTATSTRQIAQEAGIGKATVYHHFKDKQTIVLALMEREIEATRPALAAVRVEPDLRCRIQMIVEGNLRFYFDAGDILQIIQREVQDGAARVQAEYLTCRRELSTLIEDTLLQGSKQGLFRSIDPSECARLLLVMIEGTFAMTYLAGEQPQPPGKAAATILEAFFRIVDRDDKTNRQVTKSYPIAHTNEIVRNQFNKQADNFSKWSITQNRDYMYRYFAACKMTPEDNLLDVACGSGEFAIFAAPQIRSAVGVDISDRMIELAQQNAYLRNVNNVTFLCHDITAIPLDDSSFSVVICKSAFHHVHNYDKVMNEMVRCCKNGGRISIQDIVAYDNDRVNDFFEQLERHIDISHHVSLSKQFIQELFEGHNLAENRTFELNVELNFKDYLSHAVQSEGCLAEIERLLKIGLNDSEISGFFATKDGGLYFKRNVFVIIGQKLLFA